MLQVDGDNRFYKDVVSLPNAAEVFRSLLLPYYFIYRTYTRGTHYDGKLVQLCAKHGFGGSLKLMAGWVPQENCDNTVFFVSNEVFTRMSCDRGRREYGVDAM